MASAGVRCAKLEKKAKKRNLFNSSTGDESRGADIMKVRAQDHRNQREIFEEESIKWYIK